MAIKYFATTGNDGNSGSISSPYLTPQKAVDNMGAGGQALGRGGTHLLTAALSGIPSGVDVDNKSLIAAYDNEPVILRSNAVINTAMIVISDSRSYVWIRDMEIDGNANQSNDGLRMGASGSFHQVSNMDIHSLSGQGIQTNSSNDGLYEGLTIHDGGTNTLDHCMYISGTAARNILERFIFENWSGHGVHNYSDSGAPSDNIYRYGICRNNGSHGVGLHEGNNNLAHHIFSYGNGGAGISLTAFGGTVTGNAAYYMSIYDNDSGAGGIYQNSNMLGTTLHNMISLDNLNNNIVDNGVGTVLSNNLLAGTATDIWEDPVNGDFALKAATAAVGGGLAIAGITLDYNGQTIPGPPDMGALNFAQTMAMALAATRRPFVTIPSLAGLR